MNVNVEYVMPSLRECAWPIVMSLLLRRHDLPYTYAMAIRKVAAIRSADVICYRTRRDIVGCRYSDLLDDLKNDLLHCTVTEEEHKRTWPIYIDASERTDDQNASECESIRIVYLRPIPHVVFFEAATHNQRKGII